MIKLQQWNKKDNRSLHSGFFQGRICKANKIITVPNSVTVVILPDDVSK